MKYIDVLFDEEKNSYYYDCPFCKKQVLVNDGDFCKHVIFSYEDVNSRPLYIDDTLYDEFRELLINKGLEESERFKNLWEDNYMPCDTRDEDPECWDESFDEYLDYYMDECFSYDDFTKFIKYTSYKDKMDDFVVASTEGGYEYGQTYYVLYENK